MATTKELLELAEYAFHKPWRGGETAFEKLLDMAIPYVHEVDGKLASLVLDSPMSIYWDSKFLTVSCIGCVSSYPEYRGSGAIHDLMKQILHDSYERGTALSYLAPFSYAFYRHFGYEYAFDQKIYQIASGEFPRGYKTSETVGRESFAEALHDMMTVHGAAYNQGSLTRSQAVWEYNYLYTRQPHFAVFRENGRAAGYLIYSFEGMDFVIRELISLTDEAKQGLYRFISSHAGAFDRIVWEAPSSETLERELTEPRRATVLLKAYMMARIVNLDAFLAVNGEPDFAVTITDDLLPANNRSFGKNPINLTIGQFTAKILRDKGAILREYF